jgi:threonine dehydratase
MDAMQATSKIDIHKAALRLQGVTRITPLEALVTGDERLEVRLKLECLQETNSFKARGAWNHMSQLPAGAEQSGVVATSSGNHGRAVSWAAKRAGVPATIFMPKNVYPNKLAACKAEGAEVVLCETRGDCDVQCGKALAAGAIDVHPYDAENTVEGAGTVGLEIAKQWPEVEVVFVPCGGGGLLAGVSLAISRELGDEVAVVGVEPEGSTNMSSAMEAGKPVDIDPITTQVQGLCPLNTGALNLAICNRHVESMVALEDAEIIAGQRKLVQAGYTVEPAGGAGLGAVLAGAIPEDLLEGRDASNPLRIVCVVTGGNPDPEQLESLR